MVLKNNTNYSIEEICEWFGIKKNTFSKAKEKKLEELTEYCSYTILGSQKRIAGIYVGEVWCGEYFKTEKNRFLSWLAQDAWRDVCSRAEGDEPMSIPVIINCYCSMNNIPYDGSHYIWEQEEGRSLDGKRKIIGSNKIPNPKYAKWHYLYRQARTWLYNNGYSADDGWIDCSADSYNPTFLKTTTPEMKELRDNILEKYLGKVDYAEVLEVADYIEDYPEEFIDKKELQQLRLIAKMSDKQKRQAAAEECIANKVLFRKGYVWQDLKCGTTLE